MSHSVNLAAVDDAVDSYMSQIHTTIQQRPALESRSLAPLLQWIVLVFTTFYDALTNIVPMVTGRLADLEARPLVAATAMATGSGGATPAPPTASTSRTGRPSRCQKCHARGHATSACRTSDAGAMRRRVAANTRIARETRATSAARVLFPSPVPPSYVPPIPPSAATPMVFAAIAADASELRRRSAQSRRDKRRHRSSTSAQPAA